jgi:hypothetical protein
MKLRFREELLQRRCNAAAWSLLRACHLIA